MSETPPGSDSRSAEAAPQDAARGSFGAWLRHQREARSVSLREIADSSKISLRYLDALEQDRFDVLPAPVFARGFLREYARVVGLNADEVVNLFLLALEERKSTSARSEPAQSARSRQAPSSYGYGLLLALAVCAFLGVAAFLSFYIERRAGSRPEPPEATAPAPRPPVAAVAPAQPPAEVPPVADRNGAASAAPGPADRIAVVLAFAQDCWVETVVDGRRRTSELRAGGETVEIEAEEVVLLTLGNADVVTVEVNGRPFPLPASGSRVVRDLRIDRSSAGLESDSTP